MVITIRASLREGVARTRYAQIAAVVGALTHSVESSSVESPALGGRLRYGGADVGSYLVEFEQERAE